MAEAVIFQIEEGVLAFSLVDTAAVGYADWWQAPLGAGVEDVTLADYGAGAASWSCQVTNGALNAAANTNAVDVPATFCQPARTIPQPGETAYTLDSEYLQDPNVASGLAAFLFENDTKEAYFLLGLDGDNPPKAIGRVRLVAGSFGGAARENLTATISLPVTRKPTLLVGDATTNRVLNDTTPAP